MHGLHGVVLAGGISSRMGFPKALLPYRNSFFLHTVYERLVAAGASPIHVVVNTGLHIALNAQLCRFPHALFVANPEPARGQMFSLQLGLRSAKSHGALGALIGLVDLPGVAPETVQTLVAEAAARTETVLIPRHRGRTGHPYIVLEPAFDAFLGAGPDTTARDVIGFLSADVGFVDVEDGRILVDYDSPADLAADHLLEDELD